MRKYDLVSILSETKLSFGSAIKDIYNDIFNNDDSPKEILAIVVTGFEIVKENEPDLPSRRSFIRVYVYNNIIDAFGKLDEFSNFKEVHANVFGINPTKYRPLLMKMMGKYFFTNVESKARDLGDKAFTSFNEKACIKDIIEIMTYF